jgi:hypothetical protein
MARFDVKCLYARNGMTKPAIAALLSTAPNWQTWNELAITVFMPLQFPALPIELSQVCFDENVTEATCLYVVRNIDSVSTH